MKKSQFTLKNIAEAMLVIQKRSFIKNGIRTTQRRANPYHPVTYVLLFLAFLVATFLLIVEAIKELKWKDSE